MGHILLIALICIPILEIMVFIEAGYRIGWFYTVFIIILTTIAGTTLLRTQGLSVLIQAQASLKLNKFPMEEVLDGLCIIFAGVLLLTPGFVTDVIGFLIFLPPFRSFIKIHGVRFIKTRIQIYSASSPPHGIPANKIIDGDFQDITKQSGILIDEFDTKRNSKDRF